MSCSSSQQLEDPKFTAEDLLPSPSHATSTSASSSGKSTTPPNDNVECKSWYISTLPEKYTASEGPEYECLRTLFRAHVQERDTMSALLHAKTAELLSLMFASLFSVYDSMAVRTTLQNAKVFEEVYNELWSSCREIVTMQLVKTGKEVPDINFSVTKTTMDPIFGKKPFDADCPVLPSLYKYDNLLLSPSPEEWKGKQVMVDLLYWHADRKRAFYTYTLSMNAYVSYALRNRCLFIAHILVRYTLFSIKLVVQLLECSMVSTADSSKSAPAKSHALWFKMNTVLSQMGSMVFEDLVNPAKAYEKYIISERDATAMTRAAINMSTEQISKEVDAALAASAKAEASQSKGGCLLL